MSSATVYTAIKSFLTANWSATPIQWENETFEIPQPTEYPATPASWLSVEFSGGAYEQMSIGSGSPANERWKEGGSVLIYALVQSGAGTLVCHQHVETLIGLFKGLVLPNGLLIQSMRPGDGGPGDENGNWWQIPLRIHWDRG